MAIDLASYGGSTLPLGLAGTDADMGPQRNVTYINESATAIDFGVAVAMGAASTGPTPNCKPPGTSDIIVGITKRNANRVPDSSGNIKIPRYDSVPVKKIGSIYVIAAEDVREGDIVLALSASGGTLAGSKGGAASSTRLVVPNAIWATTTTAGTIGIVRMFGGETGRTTT